MCQQLWIHPRPSERKLHWLQAFKIPCMRNISKKNNITKHDIEGYFAYLPTNCTQAKLTQSFQVFHYWNVCTLSPRRLRNLLLLLHWTMSRQLFSDHVHQFLWAIQLIKNVIKLDSVVLRYDVKCGADVVRLLNISPAPQCLSQNMTGMVQHNPFSETKMWRKFCVFLSWDVLNSFLIFDTILLKVKQGRRVFYWVTKRIFKLAMNSHNELCDSEDYCRCE
jgi:hypothetical protein